MRWPQGVESPRDFRLKQLVMGLDLTDALRRIVDGMERRLISHSRGKLAALVAGQEQGLCFFQVVKGGQRDF
jgi:hypothetical protein